MANASMVTTPKNGSLAPADEWSSKLDLIKRTVAIGATNDELELFLHQARKTGLDPLARQIYCIKRGDRATIQTGIDGYRLIADRTGKYAGNDDAVFGGEHAAGAEGQQVAAPLQATVTVWKLVGGQRCPFSATARWSEYYPGEKLGRQWHKMPYVMLAKCAEALALRKAFPADLSGIYTDTEMHQADAPAPLEAAMQPDAVDARTKRLIARYDELVTDAKAVGLHPEALPDRADEGTILRMGTALRDAIAAQQRANGVPA